MIKLLSVMNIKVAVKKEWPLFLSVGMRILGENWNLYHEF